MTSEDIYTKLKEEFGDSILSFEEVVLDSFILIVPEAIADIARYLAEEDELAFDSLMCLSGVDLGVKEENLELVYHLFSMTHRHTVVLKTILPKEDPHIPSVEDIWKTANWHEREAYDLYGINFEGTQRPAANPDAGGLGRAPAAQGLQGSRVLSWDASAILTQAGVRKAVICRVRTAHPTSPSGIKRANSECDRDPTST